MRRGSRFLGLHHFKIVGNAPRRNGRATALRHHPRVALNFAQLQPALPTTGDQARLRGHPDQSALASLPSQPGLDANSHPPLRHRYARGRPEKWECSAFPQNGMWAKDSPAWRRFLHSRPQLQPSESILLERRCAPVVLRKDAPVLLCSRIEASRPAASYFPDPGLEMVDTAFCRPVRIPGRARARSLSPELAFGFAKSLVAEMNCCRLV